MKKIRTRKEKTLLGMLALVLLLAIAMGTHLMGFTPGQNIRAVEDLLGLAPTEPVMNRDGWYLTENDDVLLLTFYTPGLWRDRWGNDTLNFVVADKPDDPPVAGGGHYYQDYQANQATFHLFGKVLLEEAASVRAYCNVDPSYHYRSVELTADVFTAENGNRYFWSVTTQDLEPIDHLPIALDVLDEEGNVLCTYDSSQNWAIGFIE